MSTIKDKVSRLIRPEIGTLEAYHVPHAHGLIKLDAMESPYRLPPALRAEWLRRLDDVEINRYPDPRAQALKAQLRTVLEVPAEMDLLLGNGSDELIQIILLALARPGAVALAPVPTFAMYRTIADMVGLRFAGVPLQPDFGLDRHALRAAIERERPAVIFLAYPNNPSGNLFDAALVRELIAGAPGLVVVDEAYHAFCGASFLPELARHDNLLVLRTLSKEGLAGLRLGILVGRREWLTEFDKLRLPYNIGSLNQASAEFALAHRAVLDEQAALIRAERERLYAALAALPEVEVWPSAANFILFRPRRRPAGEVHAALVRAGVLVKNLDAAGSALAGCLRVTVGTPEENAAFLAALAAA